MEVLNLGIDLGYNAVKAHANGVSVTFPSVVGTPDRSRFGLNVNDNSSIITIPGDGTWMFGTGAVEKSRIVQRREDRDWIQSNEYYRLFIAALASLVPEEVDQCAIVTGLPLAFFGDKHKLSQIILGKHVYQIDGKPQKTVSIETCRVIPQPFGTLLNAALSDTGDIADAELARGTVGIVDCGGKTTNLLAVSRMNEINRQTDSVNVGGWDIVRAIGSHLSQLFPDIDLRDFEIVNAIVNRKVKYFGEYKDISNEIESVVSPMAQQVVAQATQLWNSGASLDRILVTGGGALLIGSYIKNKFPHAVVVENPIFANVIGYWKFSHRI